MPRLAEIEARITSIAGLLDVVGAMRSLAGMRLQEAQHMLPAARRYAKDVSAAISSALRMARDPPVAGYGATAERRGIVVYASEQGFVGALNGRLLATARAAISPRDSLFLLGTRAAAIALEHRIQAAWTAPMATRPTNVPETVRLLTNELYRQIAREELTGIDLIYTARSPEGTSLPRKRTLIPLDLSSLATPGSGPPPLSNLAPPKLLERLTAEYVFALLAEAALESLASENGARFAAMTAARENVSRKLEDLHATAREIRQSEITTELLDIVTGAQALR